MTLAYTDDESVATEEDKLIPEVWELTIDGRVSVNLHLPGGTVRNISRKGKGQRLRLSTYDRKVAQEACRLDNNDAFANGMLVRVDLAGAQVPKSSNELDDQALADIFKLDEYDYLGTLDTLTEVNVRRLKDLAKKHKATAVQLDAINDMIEAKWKVGGTSSASIAAKSDG